MKFYFSFFIAALIVGISSAENPIDKIGNDISEIQTKIIEHFTDTNAGWFRKWVAIYHERIIHINRLPALKIKLQTLIKSVEVAGKPGELRTRSVNALRMAQNDLELLHTELLRLFGKRLIDLVSVTRSLKVAATKETVQRLDNTMNALSKCSSAQRLQSRIPEALNAIERELDGLKSDATAVKPGAIFTEKLAQLSEYLQKNIVDWTNQLKQDGKWFINAEIITNTILQELDVSTVSEVTLANFETLKLEYQKVKNDKQSLNPKESTKFAWFRKWCDITERVESMLITVFTLLDSATKSKEIFERKLKRNHEKHSHMSHPNTSEEEIEEYEDPWLDEEVSIDIKLDLDSVIGHLKISAVKLWKIYGGNAKKFMKTIETLAMGPVGDRLAAVEIAFKELTESSWGKMSQMVPDLLKKIEKNMKDFTFNVEEIPDEWMPNFAIRSFRELNKAHSEIISLFESDTFDIDEFVSQQSKLVEKWSQSIAITTGK